MKLTLPPAPVGPLECLDQLDALVDNGGSVDLAYDTTRWWLVAQWSHPGVKVGQFQHDIDHHWRLLICALHARTGVDGPPTPPCPGCARGDHDKGHDLDRQTKRHRARTAGEAA